MASWQCETCTLINPASQDHCNACNNPRQKGPVLTLDPGSHAGEDTHAQASAVGSSASSKVTMAAQPANVPSNSVGLHSAERKAREDDMAAKRQKKEEEKQRILAQAEADRRAREEDASRFSGAASAPAQQQEQQQQQAQAAQSKPLPSSVRLQLRCPQWNRSIVLTSLSPTSTIGEARQKLREELLQGLPGDDTAALAARVPKEEDIVLAESVPPRRKFVTADDMQTTLAAAGLCPSSMLLVDAAPIVPETFSAEPPSGNAGLPDAPTQSQQDQDEQEDGRDDRDEDDEDGDQDEDYDSDEGDDDLFGSKGNGKGKATGSGTFGQGSSWSTRPAAVPGGIRPGNTRGGSSRLGGASTGPRIGAGGQILGSGPAPAAGSTSEEQRAAREARLKALERRAAAESERPVEPSVAASAGNQASSSAAPAPALPTPSEKPLEGKAKRDAERQEILRQVAEERAERAARTGQTLSQAPKPAAPAEEAGRIKGQLGGGSSKAERARERAAILQQMEEDRSRYQEMHVAEKVVAAQVAANTQSASANASGSVRLQIRCASSGQSVTTTDFTAGDLLISVRDFAAKELGLMPGSGTDGPELSLAFPPRTAFTAEEQINASLGSLGLAPSAGLIIKGLAACSAPADSADAGQQAAGDAGDAAQGSSGVAPCCPIGHAMAQHEPSEELWCDRCQESLSPGSVAFTCASCDYIECATCAGRDVR
eukprot:TRINITY_DN3913_c0_g1_i1.p1 TRINITY_DN3913_c0_g1~~TRINITY_DN3913_c0_g1_i1.p1  ORF type:complete len:713 (-),score=177.88 TRINITY_DN3913_c0_g1_i1:136-2274(-)